MNKTFREGLEKINPKTLDLMRSKGLIEEDLSYYKVFILDGKFHNIDGPAIIAPDGYEEYHLNGVRYSKEEYYNKIKIIKNLQKL